MLCFVAVALLWCRCVPIFWRYVGMRCSGVVSFLILLSCGSEFLILRNLLLCEDKELLVCFACFVSLYLSIFGIVLSG